MSRTLILYATTEGPIARIAERISQRLWDMGHTVEAHRADAISPATAQRYLETFLHQVDWPRQTATFAGALQYSKYGTFKKLLMRLIARMVGKDTDTTRDANTRTGMPVAHFGCVCVAASAGLRSALIR